jgi:hypothetical protein
LEPDFSEAIVADYSCSGPRVEAFLWPKKNR